MSRKCSLKSVASSASVHIHSALTEASFPVIRRLVTIFKLAKLAMVSFLYCFIVKGKLI